MKLYPSFMPDKRGFTLMEVMIALAVLAITLTAVFQNQSQSIAMETQSRFLTTASLLAQSKMAELESADLDEIASLQGDFGEDFTDYEWDISVDDTEMELLKKVTLEVKNVRMTSNNTYRIILYRPNKYLRQPIQPG